MLPARYWLSWNGTRSRQATFVRLTAIAFNAITLVVGMLFGVWCLIVVAVFYGFVLALAVLAPEPGSAVPASPAPGEVSSISPNERPA